MRLDDDFIRLIIISLCLVIVYIFILTPLNIHSKGCTFFDNLVTKTAYILFYNNHKEADIIIIALDDESLDFKGLKWPWPRKTFAELV